MRKGWVRGDGASGQTARAGGRRRKAKDVCSQLARAKDVLSVMEVCLQVPCGKSSPHFSVRGGNTARPSSRCGVLSS